MAEPREKVEHKDRDRAIGLAISQIERQFGKGSIMKMGDAAARMQVEAIPTGSIALDLTLGIGGVPRGRVVEIYGPESSGKTTLAQHIIAEAQRMGGTGTGGRVGTTGGVMSRDDQRFAVFEGRANAPSVAQLVWVQHWVEDVRARVALVQ